jgi:hypothetical protein
MRYNVCPVQGLLTANVQRTAKGRNWKYLWLLQKCSFVQKAAILRWSAALFWPRHLNRACSPNICCAAARSCVLRQGSPWTLAGAYYTLHPASMRLTTPHLQLYRPLGNAAGGRLPISRADASICASIAGANGRLGPAGQTAPATPVAARKIASIASYEM